MPAAVASIIPQPIQPTAGQSLPVRPTRGDWFHRFLQMAGNAPGDAPANAADSQASDEAGGSALPVGAERKGLPATTLSPDPPNQVATAITDAAALSAGVPSLVSQHAKATRTMDEGLGDATDQTASLARQMPDNAVIRTGQSSEATLAPGTKDAAAASLQAQRAACDPTQVTAETIVPWQVSQADRAGQAPHAGRQAGRRAIDSLGAADVAPGKAVLTDGHSSSIRNAPSPAMQVVPDTGIAMAAGIGMISPPPREEQISDTTIQQPGASGSATASMAGCDDTNAGEEEPASSLALDQLLADRTDTIAAMPSDAIAGMAASAPFATIDYPRTASGVPVGAAASRALAGLADSSRDGSLETVTVKFVPPSMTDLPVMVPSNAPARPLTGISAKTPSTPPQAGQSAQDRPQPAEPMAPSPPQVATPASGSIQAASPQPPAPSSQPAPSRTLSPGPRANDASAAPDTATPGTDTAPYVIPITSAPVASISDTPQLASVTPAGIPEPPVQQVAPALFSLARSPDGGQQMTLRLHPEELGMVQIRIDSSQEGPVRITVTAEKPETLELLKNEQLQLHQTLNDAGIPSVGRTLSFALASLPQQPDSTINGGHSPHAQGQQTGNSDGSDHSGQFMGEDSGRQDSGRQNPGRGDSDRNDSGRNDSGGMSQGGNQYPGQRQQGGQPFLQETAQAMAGQVTDFSSNDLQPQELLI